jgi:hypothetical protein
MKNLDTLRKDADAKQVLFLDALNGAVEQLKPARIANATLARIDPDFNILKQVQQKSKSNPFAILAAIAGLLLLFRQLSGNEGSPKIGNRVRRVRLAHSTPKGGHHGQFSDTKQQ